MKMIESMVAMIQGEMNKHKPPPPASQVGQYANEVILKRPTTIYQFKITWENDETKMNI